MANFNKQNDDDNLNKTGNVAGDVAKGIKNGSKAIKSGSKAAKGTAKAAKGAAKGASSALKAIFSNPFSALVFLVVVVILIVVIVIASLFSSTIYTSPMVMIKSQSVNDLQYKMDNNIPLTDEEQDEYDSYANPDEFYKDASDFTKEQFKSVKDYSTSANAFTAVTNNYLQQAYESRLANTLAESKLFLNGESVENINDEMTKQEFMAQGDPFANANICAIASAYGVYDDLYSQSSLKKLDNKMGSPFVQSRFLTATYYWDTVENEDNKANDGVANFEKTVIPVDIYSYKLKQMDLSKNDYFMYLSYLEPGSSLIENCAIETLDAKIKHEQEIIDGYNDRIDGCGDATSDYNKEIKDLEDRIENLETANEFLSFFFKNGNKKIDENNAEIEKLRQQIQNKKNGISSQNSQADALKAEMQPYIDSRDFCQYVRDEIKKGNIKATVENIATDYMKNTYKDVVCYYMEYHEDGNPVVDHEVSDENGNVENRYLGFMKDGNDIYYVKSGTEMIYPEIQIDNYAQVKLEPFSSDVRPMLQIFGLNPDDKYVPSKNVAEQMWNKIKSSGMGAVAFFKQGWRSLKAWATGEEVDETEESAEAAFYEETTITNEEAFWNYYKILREQTSMERYTQASGTHACSLTMEEIQNYVNNAAAQYPGLSLNRQEFIKTALSLTGAVPYEWGGKPSKPGWDETWWSSTGKPDAPNKGLDCSGFVSWVRWTAYDIQTKYSTGEFSSSCSVVDEYSLKPGDLGVIYLGSSSSRNNANHVGIYLGKDAEGNKLWCHCTGGNANTVVVNKTNCFKVYLRLNDSCVEGSDKWHDWSEYTPYGFAISDADAMDVATRCLIAEDSSDVGLCATSEAMANACGGGMGRPTTEEAMKAQAMKPTYLVGGNGSQYHMIYETGEKQIPAPTINQLQIVEASTQGRRMYITDDRCRNWRSKTITSLKGYTWFGQFPEGSGNNFFIPNK